MKVILLTDVKKVGQRGTLVTVADGYANNVLIPKKLALPATPQNLKQYERKVQGEKERQHMDASLAKATLSEIEGKTVQIKTRASEKGTLFDSIHEKQVADAIAKELKISIPESSIHIPEGVIKKLGEHRVIVSLHDSHVGVQLLISKI